MITRRRGRPAADCPTAPRSGAPWAVRAPPRWRRQGNYSNILRERAAFQPNRIQVTRKVNSQAARTPTMRAPQTGIRGSGWSAALFHQSQPTTTEIVN